MRVAFVTTFLPDSRSSGADIASSNLIEAMRLAGHTVAVHGYASPTGAPPAPGEYAVAACTGEWSRASRTTRLAWACAAFANGRAIASQKFLTRAYTRTLVDIATRADAWILDHHYLDWLLPPTRRPTITVVHNIEHRLINERAGRAKLAARLLLNREARKLRQAEAFTLQHAELAWCFSDTEEHELRSLGHTARCVPLCGLDPGPQGQDPPKTHDVGLLGLWTWEPNRRGLLWFLTEVLPLLPADLSIVIGGLGTDGLPRDPRVRYAGFVPDAMAFLRSARTLVIPSTHGGGIQIKSINAISLGISTIATRFAMRGLDPPGWVTIADTAEDMARSLAAARTSGHDARAGRTWQQSRLADLARIVDQDLHRVSSQQ